MQPPAFARSYIESFQRYGSVPGVSRSYPLEGNQARYKSMQAGREFRWLRELDETYQDRYCQRPGEVRFERGRDFIEATFTGDWRMGELVVHRNMPDKEFGWESARLLKVRPDGSMDILDVGRGSASGPEIGPTITHIERDGNYGYIMTR